MFWRFTPTPITSFDYELQRTQFFFIEICPAKTRTIISAKLINIANAPL